MMQILTINMTTYDACISGDFLTADKLSTLGISTDGNDYNSYVNNSFINARCSNWDCAFDDVLKVRCTVPSQSF
jgi:hypothetical protein